MTRTANIATYPARDKALRAMLLSIKDQFDVIRICLNEYETVPEDLAGYECFIPEVDMKDMGKFHWLNDSNIDELYFTMDDDLIYPPDYADRMAAHLVYAELVSAHGHTITATDQDWHDEHSVHTFNSAQNSMQYMHVGGTGCMAIQGGAISIDMENWQPGFADADLALECAEKNILILLVPHHENWITEQPKLKGTPLSTSGRKHPRLSDISNRVFTIWKDGFPLLLKKFCYTIITNGYDLLRQPEYITPGWEYVVVTDNVKGLAAAGTGAWRAEDIEELIEPTTAIFYVDKSVPQSKQRVAKACGSADSSRSIYVDANMVITGDLDVLVLETGHRSGVITSKEHPSRDCVFDEADAIIELGKDTQLRVKKWIERLGDIGRTYNAGLSETGVLIRDHSSDETDAVNKAQRLWLMLMNAYSWRDQLTFDFAVETFSASNRQPEAIFNRFVKWTPHSSTAPVPVDSEPEVEAKDPEITVETIPAGANPQPEEKLSLGIVTSSTTATMGLVPLFVMAALDHNPDAFVTVLVPPGADVADMEPVIERHGALNYLLAPATVMDGVMADPAVAPYLYQPPTHTDLLYCCPISQMILTDLRAAYLPIMEKNKVPYVNAMNEFETRLTPLHFTRWEAMHPHPMVQQSGHDLFKPVGYTLGRIVNIVTQKPLSFSEMPDIGIDIFAPNAMVAEWQKLTTTDSFALAVKDLSEEGVEWLRSLGKN